MPIIIPSTDLRNNFAQVERVAKDSKEPIYLTKNGRGSLVVMDIDAFEAYHAKRAYQQYVEKSLADAEQAASSGVSQYESMETAFEKLLTEEPGNGAFDGREAAEGEGDGRQIRHASA